jgi:hypothetical protein
MISAGAPATLVAGGEPVLVAHGSVPAGGYRHTFVGASRAEPPGEPDAQLVLHVEPIARAVVVPDDGKVDVEIELIALQRSEASGGAKELFVSDATIKGNSNG